MRKIVEGRDWTIDIRSNEHLKRMAIDMKVSKDDSSLSLTMGVTEAVALYRALKAIVKDIHERRMGS